MQLTKTDILISGGGIAGLAAAAAFGNAGFEVILVDPAPPVTTPEAEGADLRTTALLQPAREILRRAGVWDSLAPHGTALQVMRIVDAGGPDGAARIVRDFEAADISDEPFGWNFPNWLLRRELVARLAELPQVDFRAGTATTSLLTRTSEARVGLDDGSRVRAKLVIAADGRNSPMRDAAGIAVHTRRYGQKALVFAVTHPIPHENVSTEIHRSGGPFTLVPLPDRDGLPCSAVVWMDDGPKVNARMELDDAAFAAEATERSGHLFGQLTPVSRRSSWPIISQEAERLTGQRLALMAEAAHVVPPIGAQGLNMSLTDLGTLLDLSEAHRDDPGNATMLDAYHAARIRDVRIRVAGIDMLNRASQLASQPLRDARALGLRALYDAGPVRRAVMQLGLGLKKAG